MEFSVEQLTRDLESGGPGGRPLSAREHGFTHLALGAAAAAPSPSGRLEGWVLSAKDLHDVAGMPTTMGAAARTYVADSTDPFLQERLDAGATIVGKSAAPELGLMVDTEPHGLDHPDNPLWPGRTPGGSSGGAAVQVARGLLRAAHASDGGGSIRVPAAACGVVGFKPAGTDLGVQGFITRTLADAALLHDLRPRAVRARVGLLTEPLFTTGPAAQVDPVMLTAAGQAAERLRARGYEVVPVKPFTQSGLVFDAFRRIFTSRLAGLEDAGEPGGYTEWVRSLGLRVTPAGLAAATSYAAQVPALLAAEWGVDAVVSPMVSFDPPEKGHFRRLPHPENFNEQTRWSPWGSLWNVARLPAACIPWPVAGRQPVGVQVGSVTLGEEELLALSMELHP